MNRAFDRGFLAGLGLAAALLLVNDALPHTRTAARLGAGAALVALAAIGILIGRAARRRRNPIQTLDRDDENRLRMALHAARMVSWEFDPATGAVATSENVAEVLGLPLGAGIGNVERGFALLHPDDRERHRAVMRKAAERGESYVNQFRIVRPDNGAVLWLEEHGHAVRRGPNGSVWLIGVVMDITQRKQAEDNLRAAERRLRFVLDSVPQKIFTATPNGEVDYFNPQWTTFTGLPFEQIRAWGWTQFIHPDDVAENVRAWKHAIETGEPFRFEHRFRRADGAYHWHISRAVPLRDAEGRILLWVGSNTDIEDVKRAERELQRSRERLDLVVSSSEIGLWYCDLPFDKLIWNAKVKEHFGLPADADVTIDIFYERLHPDDRERTRQTIEKSIRDRTNYDIEYRTVGLDGQERWIRAIGRTFYDDAGQPIRFDGITVDVTERVRQEETLREQDRRKDEFLATLAHELRNPLAPIRNALQIMRLAEENRATVEQARGLMERQLQQMVRLVDDLLEVSRISRGKIELKRERVELASILYHAVEQARPHVEWANHALKVTPLPEPVYLHADPVRLAQVFSNLLNNACKFTASGGRIGLAVERQGSDVVVRVTDSGVGIPPDKLSSIFEMFAQVDRTLERSQGGLGIGLTLAKRLVEMHEGSIEARSEGSGKGSEFLVRLPILLDAKPSPPSSLPSGEQTPATSRRFLVADDNRDAADSLTMLLRLTGHEVLTVYDGLEAVEAAMRWRPDVILLDIGMPKLNGYEAARRIREQPWAKDARLAALTGWGQEEDRRKSREAGFDGHLVKPVQYEALLAFLAPSLPVST